MDALRSVRESDATTVGSLWLLSLTAAAYLILPSGILPVIQDDLGIGAAAASWIVSTPYAAEAVVSVPVGLALSRYSDRCALALAVLSLVIASFWGWHAGAVGNLVSLLFSRFIGGAAFAVLWIASLDIISRTVDGRTATAVGVYTTSGPAGLAVSIGGAPLAERWLPWPAIFGVAAVAIAASFVVVWLTVPNVDGRAKEQSQSIQDVLEIVVTNGNLRLVAVMAFVAYSLFLFFTGWMPTYLATTFDLSIEESGLYAALFPAIGILARSSGGLASDILLTGRRRPVVRAAFFVSLPVVIGIAAATNVLAVVGLIVVGGFFIQLGIGVFYTFGPEFTAEGVTGPVVAFLTTAGLLGSFTAPVITGVLIEATGTYTAAFGYAVLLSAVGVGAAYHVAAGPDASRRQSS